jgi:hypothetical protein
MRTRDILLQQIANTLLVNVQHLPVLGLFDGQLGAALFFYRYARYSGRSSYSDYSDQVMDVVAESIYANTPKALCNGLAGIGWTVDYLMKNGFVEADEEVLEEVDAALEKMTVQEIEAEIHAETPLFSRGIYALARGNEAMIADCVGQCGKWLKDTGRNLPLGYLNSILYLLSGAYGRGIETLSCERFVRETVARIESVLERGCRGKSDLFLFERQIERISGLFPDAARWLSLGKRAEVDQDTMIRTCWSETIYGFSFSTGIKTACLADFTDRAIRDIEERNLTFYGGLAGLGLSLIETSKGI